MRERMMRLELMQLRSGAGAYAAHNEDECLTDEGHVKKPTRGKGKAKKQGVEMGSLATTTSTTTMHEVEVDLS